MVEYSAGGTNYDSSSTPTKAENRPAASSYEYKIDSQTTSVSPSKRPSNATAPGSNLWNSILQDVVKRDDQQDSHMLVLGNQGVGKRSIVREINNKYVNCRNKNMGVEQMGSDYSALDFSFLYVKDMMDPEIAESVVTTDDNLPKMNIWSVHESERCELIEAVLAPNQLSRTAALICLDFDDPMEIMSSLRTWLSALSKTLLNIVPNMEPGAHEKMKQSIMRHAQTYEEPQLDDQGNLIIRREEFKVAAVDDQDSDMSDEDDVRLDMPLGEGQLKVNLGIPIVVVCNKIDVIQANGEKAKLLQENLDFIQMHLREYCLLYGASVMFTSSKEKASKNLDTLYQYLTHRLYDYSFIKQAQVVEKDELFIPAGFDSLNLIRELCKGQLTGPDGQPLSFEDVLRPQFTAMSSGKGFGKAQANVKQEEVFTESEDWNKLLSVKYTHQEAQPKDKDAKDPSGGSASKSGAKPSGSKRETVLGASNISQSAATRKSVVGGASGASEGKSATTEEGKAAGKGDSSGQAYFVKLLRSKQFQDTKKRRSQLMAQEQAQNLATRVQNQMDENNAGADPNKVAEDEDESSSASETEEPTTEPTTTAPAAEAVPEPEAAATPTEQPPAAEPTQE